MSTCYKCGEYIADQGTSLDDLPIWLNITANAAGSVPATMKPFHRRCAPGGEDAYKFVTEAECKRRETAAHDRGRAEIIRERDVRAALSPTPAPEAEP